MLMTQDGNQLTELGPFDESNPRSIVNLVRPHIARHLLAARSAMTVNNTPAAELFEMEERELLNKLYREYGIDPGISEQRIRLNFWLEYEQAQMQGRKMEASRIASGICREDQIVRFLKKPEIVAYILCPPAEYKTQVLAALKYGMDKIHQILMKPIEGPDGEIDYRQVAAVIKITQLLDMRVHGAYTQKIEQTNKNINLNLNKAAKELNAKIGVDSVRQIEDRMKDLVAMKKVRNITDED